MKSRYELEHLTIFLKPYHRYLMFLFVCLCMIICVYRYQDGQRERKRLADSRMEHVKVCNELLEEEMAKRQEILNQHNALEIERRNREQKLLAEFTELRRTTQMENAQKLRKQLDKQCVSKDGKLNY